MLPTLANAIFNNYQFVFAVIRWLTGQHLVSVDVTEPRAHSGLAHQELTPSATTIRMDATWLLRFLAGILRLYYILCTVNVGK